MLKYIVFFFIFSTSVFSSNQLEWKKIVIPGAKCGNGEAYEVYLLNRDSKKVIVSFNSGGACWSKSTCYGPNAKTSIKPRDHKPSAPIFALENHKFNQHSVLFFPYCTGDVFAGNHVANYEGKEVHHVGSSNVIKTIEYLEDYKRLQFQNVKDLVLYGSSAGGIGALIHANKFGKIVSRKTKKTLVSDSPGLHFGPTFWEKFSQDQMNDFRENFAEVDFSAPLTDGFVAPYIKNVCKNLKKWDVAFLMGTKDFVMSRFFGEINMTEHEKLIYSDGGFSNLFQTIPNCSVWIKRTMMHTFLKVKGSWNFKVDGVSSLDFINRVHASRNHKSYVEKFD